MELWNRLNQSALPSLIHALYCETTRRIQVHKDDRRDHRLKSTIMLIVWYQGVSWSLELHWNIYRNNSFPLPSEVARLCYPKAVTPRSAEDKGHKDPKHTTYYQINMLHYLASFTGHLTSPTLCVLNGLWKLPTLLCFSRHFLWIRATAHLISCQTWLRSHTPESKLSMKASANLWLGVTKPTVRQTSFIMKSDYWPVCF